jgi:alpha-beta hydrolase superfamily lysophospholipase
MPDQGGADEILPEYDFSRGVRNKYASRYAAGSAVVVLDPDVAAAFPSAKEANEALRALAGIIQKHRSRRAPARRRSQ